MGLNLSGFLQSKLIEFIKNNDGQQLAEKENIGSSHWRVSIPRPADYKLNEMRDEFVRWLKSGKLPTSYIKDLVGTNDKDVVFSDLTHFENILKV